MEALPGATRFFQALLKVQTQLTPSRACGAHRTAAWRPLYCPLRGQGRGPATCDAAAGAMPWANSREACHWLYVRGLQRGLQRQWMSKQLLLKAELSPCESSLCAYESGPSACGASHGLACPPHTIHRPSRAARVAGWTPTAEHAATPAAAALSLGLPHAGSHGRGRTVHRDAAARSSHPQGSEALTRSTSHVPP